MQRREKILAGCVVALLALMTLRYGYQSLETSFDRREAQLANLRRDIARKELQVIKGQRASRTLAGYEARSLPADRELARSLYQNWLVALVEQSGLAGGVTSQAPQVQRGVYDRLNFTINGQGTLAEVVRLLHAFYAVDHLHQVRLLSLKPIEEGKRFDLLLGVEALVLPGAQATSELVARPSARLELGGVEAYLEPIAARNLFAPHVPPPPPKPKPPARPPVVTKPAPPAFDLAKYTTLSAIVEDRGQPQVWLNNRTTGDVLRLSEGGEFSIGTLRGTVGRIGLREIEVLVEGRRFLLGLGENLREGSLLPDGDL